jgi:hypothetical protein
MLCLMELAEVGGSNIVSIQRVYVLVNLLHSVLSQEVVPIAKLGLSFSLKIVNRLSRVLVVLATSVGQLCG